MPNRMKSLSGSINLGRVVDVDTETLSGRDFFGFKIQSGGASIFYSIYLQQVSFYSMESSVTAQDNEPRVTFITRKFLSIQEEMPTVVIVRKHIPLSAAMQLIVTDRQLPDGMYEQYLIEPEND